ncbi:MAG TPA: CHAT domain-containing protein, partial [Candidatus Angelobacter sp.]|nr:CHAT domain-containing protein [Candidatus Angelobacter sp.]
MQRATLLVLLFCLATALRAQSPFQFREAAFLEDRLHELGESYNTGHTNLNLQEAPSPANQLAIDPTAVSSYTNPIRMAPMLQSIDAKRRSGATKMAEARYRAFISMIRKAQGPSSSDEALLLDHLAEFYLETRNFRQAYQTFSEALKIRRITVAAAQDDSTDAMRGDPQRKLTRLHLADLLTRLGQLDLAQGDLAAADAKLSEAVTINNTLGYMHYVNRLDPIYFKSLLLERQGKWQEAEALWREAVARRAIMGETPYWDAMKESAAFFARRGDFHAAANIARRVVQELSIRPMKKAAAMPYWTDPRARLHVSPVFRESPDIQDEPTAGPIYYEEESMQAMAEILAIDRWMTEGPESAAALITDPMSPNAFSLERGSDADLLRLYAWMEKKVFLRMSVLLDGGPSPERVAAAYKMLAKIKGHYVAMLTEISRAMDSSLLNPGVTGERTLLPLKLAEIRERYTNAFFSLAFQEKGVSQEEFADIATEERTASEGMTATCTSCFSNILDLSALQDGSAFIDMVQWERLDRNDPAHKTQQVYGAFVFRKGEQPQYIPLGSVKEVDGLVMELDREAVAFFQNKTDNMQAVKRTLESLYSRILAPMKGSLQGAAHIFVVSDGQLSLVPFGALINPQGRYFMEDHTVAYLTSWRQLSRNFFGNDGKPSLPVVVGAPDFEAKLMPEAPGTSSVRHFSAIPGARDEAQDVGAALHLPADRILTGKAAREELVHSLRGPEILHLATHSDPFLQAQLPLEMAPDYDLYEFPSILSAQDPLLHSVIALAGANRPQSGPEDGLLTGLEVASLHLSGTRLVVLSSCQSANGTLVNGQGIPGLRAAFSIAGAHALVMNVWPVDDQASRQFMQFFYSHLDQGPAEAMRQAQQHLMNHAQFQNPLYWAGYTYSDNRPADRGTNSVFQSLQEAGAAELRKQNEQLIAPRCFQLSGVTSTSRGLTNRFTARIKLGGVVHKLQSSDELAVYDTHLPGNEFEFVDDINGTPSDDPRRASEENAFQVVVHRTKDISSIAFQMGEPPFYTIMLKGPGRMFPDLEIPEKLPQVSSIYILHRR